MAFGGSGFSFGANNNNTQQPSSGFGSSLFGGNNTNNNNSGFGASTGTTGFGTSTTAANPFGGGTSTFGANNNNSNTSAFGANNAGSSLFGANKTTSSPFGGNTTNTGGSLFSSNSNAGGFGTGGFGATSNAGFGANNATTGNAFSFGNTANKPAFGTPASTTPLFGQGGTGTTGGFGSTTPAFGGGTGSALNQPVPPSDGTASTPFAPTADKEANGTNNSYQSITFQQPYQKYCFEELRLADYNAGRRFGNGSGQAGAFGTSSFGGFGSSNTGGAFGGGSNTATNPFGGAAATTTASGGFGATTATSGFGNNTGGGLFGNKPAGGLFGAQTTASGTTGGLFGTANNNNNTNTGFGGSSLGGGTLGFGNNSNTTTGGGLFGNTQNKPAGGLFGNTGQTTTNSLFGNNNNQASTNTGGGLFGGTTATNTGGGLFGNNQQSNTSGGGLFGNNNQQQKPGGLFGGTGGFSTATTQNQASGGLFGTANNNTTNTGGGLFGTTSNNNTGGGLFGNNTNTNTGGGLFGNTNQAGNAGGGLFGNNAQTQNKPGGLFGTSTTGGGLFSNTNNTTNQSGGLFNNNNTNTGGGLFGNANTNKPTNSLFGNSGNMQSGGGLFGSTNGGGGLFGNSQNAQQQGQQLQQDGVKHASLLDPNPYGQSSIWTGLPVASPDNSKPVFTPLTASQKLKESMMKPPPSLRLNQSRYMTPPRRNGYGFTYSTYGTPNSAASTPGGAGLSGSMYGSRGWSGGSFGRSFNKSASVQNLRAQFSSDNDELWKPGAFASTGRHSSGSIKRLTIDRSIRNDLFSRPTPTTLTAPPAEKPASSGASNDAAAAAEPSAEPQTEPTKFRKRVSFDNSTTGGQLNGESGALVRTESPEADDEPSGRPANGEAAASRGKELAAVPEDRESNHVSSRSAEPQSRADPNPGDYWMKPSRAEMAKMPREKLQKFRDFQVGRQGCGQVTFNGTVDLSALPLDELYDKIVEIRLRSITVYPDASSKPPVGKGLNVPSTIAIENSWPRARNQPSSATSGPILDKHVNRLKKMAGTEYVDYEVDSGIWTFRVPHYTRYGLDYDDEADTDMSELSDPPDSIEKAAINDTVMEVDAETASSDDDTFAFKHGKTVPGGFGRQSIVDFDFEPASSAMIPAPESDMDEDNLSEKSGPYSDDDYSEDEPSMVGAYPGPGGLNFDSPNKPILKAPGTPGRPLLDLDGDWADQLQQTISPRKQNRDLLRGAQAKTLLDRAYSPIKPKIHQQPFRTSVDLMSSIFGKYEESRTSVGSSASTVMKSKEAADFELPDPKRTKTSEDDNGLSDSEREWEHVMMMRCAEVAVRAEEFELRPQADKEMAFNLDAFLSSSLVELRDGAPYVEHQNLPFSYIADKLPKTAYAQVDQQEKDVYALAHILFDTYEDKYSLDMPATDAVHEQLTPLVRRDRLTDFLSSYISRKHGEKISRVEKENLTAAALLKLAGHDIQGACDSLRKAKNYKLMVLVSQLENASQAWQQDVRDQIDSWRGQNVLSEITDDVRAIYEVCSGNVAICKGKSGTDTAVEDRSAVFVLSEEYGLDWMQCFAMGLWYGADEKRTAKSTGVNIEDAVREYQARWVLTEEVTSPHGDAMWALLELYAALQGEEEVQAPSFPQALDQTPREGGQLRTLGDISRVFSLYFACVGHIEGLAVDHVTAEYLPVLLAWQLSLQRELAGAVYALLHIQDVECRTALVHALLERFAPDLPEAPTDTTADNAPQAWITAKKNGSEAQNELWTTLTSRLRIPPAWIFLAKAKHARDTDPSGHTELEYLIAAESWNHAHERLIRCVAPGCIVDGDYELLARFIRLFGNEAEQKVGDWFVHGGGVYADFVRLVESKFPSTIDEDLINGLAMRLTNMGKEFEKEGSVDLGTLPVESLEERVALTEMSRVVAEKMGDNLKQILSLPITSDLRLKYTMQLSSNYYRDIMADGAGSV